MPGSNSRPNVSEGYEVPTELPGSTGLESLIPYINYIQHISTSIVTEPFTYHCTAVCTCLSTVLLLSSKIWDGTYIPISFNETGSTRSCHNQRFEKSLLRKVPGNCYNKLPTFSSPSAPPTIQQTWWPVQESSGVNNVLVRFKTAVLKNGRLRYFFA